MTRFTQWKCPVEKCPGYVNHAPPYEWIATSIRCDSCETILAVGSKSSEARVISKVPPPSG